MQLSEAEWRLMRVIWRRHPVTARQALDAVAEQTQWAYTTVKTMLMRLVDKGVLRAEKNGNTTVFAPLLSEEDARQTAVDSLMERAFDGAFGPLMHFLIRRRKLPPKQRAELERLIAEFGDADPDTPEDD